MVERDAITELVTREAVARDEFLTFGPDVPGFVKDISGAAKLASPSAPMTAVVCLIAAAEPKKVLAAPSLAVTFCSVKVPAGVCGWTWADAPETRPRPTANKAAKPVKMEVRVMVRGICGVVCLIMFPPLMNWLSTKTERRSIRPAIL